MLDFLIPRSNQPGNARQNQPDWWVVWGEIDRVEPNQGLRISDRLAIFSTLTPVGDLPVAVWEDLYAIGDVWLSDRQSLLKRLGIAPLDWVGNDLELIVRLWYQDGDGSLDLLQGMFALLIYDRRSDRLFIIRDPVGMKTLYYSIITAKSIAIAPRLVHLYPYRSSTIDPIALRDYLCCSFVPGERTMWQDLKELRPGTILTLPDRQISTYWQLPQTLLSPDRDLDWHGLNLRDLLFKIVQEYLPQDRAVGVFLSGGLDSSAIAAIITQLHDRPVHTYSIHFGDACPNELLFSNLVAQHCQTEHHVLEINFAQMWSQLPQTMAYLDDPIGDPLTVPNLLLGRLAAQSVDTIFNGEGGDPCFGGPKNQPMLIDSLYGTSDREQAIVSYLNSFQKCAIDLPKLLVPDLWKLVQSESSIYQSDLLNSEVNYLNRLMGINIKYKGADQILTKVSNLTQAANLQPRSPLFDRRIVELSMQIPPAYKLAGSIEKAVLKAAVRDLLPSEIIDRPKSGMMVPVQLGFKQYWHRQAKSLLLNRNAKIAPYCDREMIKSWLAYQNDPWQRYGVKLWLLVSLELWLQAAEVGKHN
jgi:asparagine synthase (glutamine-hydrolysing)